ncbi:MAG: hypothetical protein ACO1OT_10155, partial [Heyndrickxia sp.]
MGWIKNLKKIFGNNESEEYEELENLESVRHEPINGQMETKVTYQYPKGNFRFPLRVEEKSNTTSHRTSTSKNKENNNNQQHHQHRQQPSPMAKIRPSVDETVERSFKKTVETSTPLEQRERAQTKIQPKIKQPFRPTEIPSPVYGFHRPPRRNNSNSKNQVKDLNHPGDKDLQWNSGIENDSNSAKIDMGETNNSLLKKEVPLEHTLDNKDPKTLPPFESEMEDQLLPKQTESNNENVFITEQSWITINEKKEQEAEDQTLAEQGGQEEEVFNNTNQMETVVEEHQDSQENILQNKNQSEIKVKEEPLVEQTKTVDVEHQDSQEITLQNKNQSEIKEEEPLAE